MLSRYVFALLGAVGFAQAAKVKTPPVPDNEFGCASNTTIVVDPAAKNMEYIDTITQQVFICNNCTEAAFNAALASPPAWHLKNGPRTRMTSTQVLCHSPGYPHIVKVQAYNLTWVYAARIMNPNFKKSYVGNSTYVMNTIWRDNYYTYKNGTKTYQLIDDLGRKYIMQTSTMLAMAGKNLPAGWKYVPDVVLDRDVVVHADNNMAVVVNDGFGNAYQRFLSN